MSATEIIPDIADRPSRVTVEYCGEWLTVDAGKGFTIGRDADLTIDDNPFLHRHFLQIARRESLWWLVNSGSRLTATVTDTAGRVQAWLAPGARLPLVFEATSVIFTAGPTTYEFAIHVDNPPFAEANPATSATGVTTVGTVELTESQHLLILALAEPMLLRDGTGMSSLPTSAAAAKRLGWSATRLNRKLDNVCEKLTRAGVQGLHGGASTYATNRRARLVEHAIATRIVSRDDLRLLDQPHSSLDPKED